MLDLVSGHIHKAMLNHLFKRKLLEPFDVFSKVLALIQTRTVVPVICLERIPESSWNAEDAFELDRRRWRDGGLSSDDLIDRLNWPGRSSGEFSLRHATLFKNLSKGLPRRYGVVGRNALWLGVMHGRLQHSKFGFV